MARQQVVDGVVGHLEYMGVPGDEELRTHGLDLGDGARVVAARIAPDVGHQHLHLLAAEGEEVGVDAAGHAAVDVARDGAQGLEGGNAVGQLERPDVSRMPDLIDLAQKVAQRLVEAAVRVGNDAYFFQCGLGQIIGWSMNNVQVTVLPSAFFTVYMVSP